ncbi:MAG: response regulator [Pseudobacteriovorax sp.]|nr:response regulator [Pseudobacteriovorax sp.]
MEEGSNTMSQSHEILLVDDQKENNLILTLLLRRLGCKGIVSTECPNLATTIFSDRKPKLVFMDISMPKQSGFALVESIYRISTTETRPYVCMISGHQQSMHQKQIDNLGIEAFIEKPIDVNQLKAVLDHFKHTQKGQAAA